MARLIQTANTEGNNEVLKDFSPLPPGEYVAMITKSEFKATKAKDGHYLNLTIKVVDGEYKGRVLFDRLNLDNPNPVAVEIANKALNTICKACGKIGVQDSEELHGIPMLLTVSLKQATKVNPASNEIKFYDSVKTTKEIPNTVQNESAKKENSKKAESKLPWE